MSEILTLHRKDGGRFAVEIFASENAAAPVVLIQPAMGVRAGYYRLLAEALRDAGCHVGIAELRGHEAHDDARRPGWGYDFGYHHMLHEDWPQAIAAMKARFPGSRFYLLGHSLGAQVSCLYASQHQTELDGMILIACCSVEWRLWGAPFLIYSQAAGQIGRLLGYFPGKHFRFAGREARGVMADWARLARTGRFILGKPKLDYEPALRAVTLPVLGISLEGDFFAPRHAFDALVNKMPKAALERHHLDPKALGFDGIDHFRWARKPELVLPTVRQWLDRQAGERA